MAWGGFIWGIPGFDKPYPTNYTINGFSSFIPSLEGSFIGRELFFLTFPTFWQPKLYVDEVNKYNIFATEDASVKIYDSDGNLIQELEVSKLSMTRTSMLEPWKVYRVVSNGNIMIYGTTADSMVYVPSLTGGYVGRDFMATRAGSIWYGDKQSFIVVALEDTKVEFYDMRKPAGSAADKTIEVKKYDMVFDTSIQANVPVRVKSSGDITLLIGGNEPGWGAAYTLLRGYVTPENIASDIALLGAKEGQEIGFYAPYRAIVFAAGDTEVEINGIPRSMRKDEFITLASGTYIVKPSNAPVIVEVLGDKSVFPVADTAFIESGIDDWGVYLISSQLFYKTYAPIEGVGGTEIYLYAGAGAVIVIVVIILVFMSRRGKS